MGVGQHTCPVSAAGGLASRGFLEMTHGKNPTAVEHFQENPVGTCFCPLHLTPHLETLPGAKGNKRSTAGKAGSRQKAENYFPPQTDALLLPGQEGPAEGEQETGVVAGLRCTEG